MTVCQKYQYNIETSLIRSKFDATQLWEQVISFSIVLFIITHLTVKIQIFFKLPKKQIISLQAATEKLEKRDTQWCTIQSRQTANYIS